MFNALQIPSVPTVEVVQWRQCSVAPFSQKILAYKQRKTIRKAQVQGLPCRFSPLPPLRVERSHFSLSPTRYVLCKCMRSSFELNIRTLCPWMEV